MFIVIEFQTDATVSSVPKHGAVMLNDAGLFLKSECYEHPAE